MRYACSASIVSEVRRPVDHAVLVHVRVGRNCIEARQLNTILARDLTPLVAGISSLAHLWEVIVFIEEVELVDVSWQELGTLNFCISKESCSLVHSGNVAAAHVGLTVPRLDSCVQPAILLGYGHHILNLHVHASGDLSNLRDVFAFNSKSFVQSLGEHHISFGRCKFRKELEGDRDELVGHERWPVASSCVYPAINEVVITVGKSFCFKEEVLGGFLIEFLTVFGGQR